jgi:tetratricopeptide (TPR) repeat protein
MNVGMAGTTYGITFSRKLRESGQYEAAIEAALQAAARDTTDPEPAFDRGAALYCLGRFDEAMEALERALILDDEAGLLEEGMLDDEVFETLRRWAEQEPARAEDILGRYQKLFPNGAHTGDVAKWRRHLANAPARAATTARTAP